MWFALLTAGVTHKHDPENRMTRYFSGNFTSGYDGDGQQAWVQYPGGSRITFTYDGDQAVLVQYTDGSVIGVTTFGANGLVSSRNPVSGANNFYTFDLSGNTCQSLTSTGAVNYTHYVSAFGFSRSSGQDLYDGMGAQFGYRDENTGFLYLLGHRFYDAQFGQFMTRDPIGYMGGVNLYGYTGNNPVNRIDPDGYYKGVDAVAKCLVFAIAVSNAKRTGNRIGYAIAVLALVACINTVSELIDPKQPPWPKFPPLRPIPLNEFCPIPIIMIIPKIMIILVVIPGDAGIGDNLRATTCFVFLRRSN